MGWTLAVLGLCVWGLLPAGARGPAPTRQSERTGPAPRKDLRPWARRVSSGLEEAVLRKQIEQVRGQEVAAAEALFGLLAEPTTPARERTAAERVLLELLPEALPEVTRRVKDRSQPQEVRGAAAALYAKARGAKAVPDLLPMLKDELRAGNHRLAARVALALGAVRHPSAVEALRQVADNTHPSFRWAVARALGETGEKAAVPILLRLLADPDISVAASANRSLERLSGIKRPFSVDASQAERLKDRWAWETWWASQNGRVLPGPGTDGLPEMAEVLHAALEWAVNGPTRPDLPPFPAERQLKEARELVVLDRNLPDVLLPVEGHEIARAPKDGEVAPGRLRAALAVEAARIDGSSAEVSLSYKQLDSGKVRDYGATLRLTRGEKGWEPTEVVSRRDPAVEERLAALEPPRVVARADTRLPVVALTVNVEGDPDATRRIAATLKRLNAPAVFFVTQGAAKQWPELIKTIAADGFDIGLRQPGGQAASGSPGSRLLEDLQAAKASLAAAAGREVRWFRPDGAEDLNLLKAASLAGMETVIWSATSRPSRPEDAAGPPAGRLLSGLSHGAILMVPDSDPALVNALTEVISAIRRRGYRLMSLPDLLKSPAPAEQAAPEAPPPSPETPPASPGNP